MSDASEIERALCCGRDCGRPHPSQGGCLAATYGRKKLADLQAAGFDVVAVNSFEHQYAEIVAQQKAIRERTAKRRAALEKSNG